MQPFFWGGPQQEILNLEPQTSNPDFDSHPKAGLAMRRSTHAIMRRPHKNDFQYHSDMRAIYFQHAQSPVLIFQASTVPFHSQEATVPSNGPSRRRYKVIFASAEEDEQKGKYHLGPKVCRTIGFLTIMRCVGPLFLLHSRSGKCQRC